MDKAREAMIDQDGLVWEKIGGAWSLYKPAEQSVPDEIPQNWKGVDGATAWHLIDRHAEGWADIGRRMDEWKAATSTPATNHIPDAGEKVSVRMEVTPALAQLAYERAFAEGDVVDFSLRIARHVAALIQPAHSISADELARIREYIAEGIESEGPLEAEHSLEARALISIIDDAIVRAAAAIGEGMK